jgi:hypothetical protein
MILRRDDPFHIKPRASVELARWLVRFTRSARPDQFRAGADAILALNRSTLELFDALRDSGVEFEMHGGGLLFLCLSDPTLDATEGRFAALGYDGEIERLGGDATRALEPSVARSVAGTLHIKPERFVRPESLTRGLVTALRKLGHSDCQCAVRWSGQPTALLCPRPRWKPPGVGTARPAPTRRSRKRTLKRSISTLSNRPAIPSAWTGRPSSADDQESLHSAAAQSGDG